MRRSLPRSRPIRTAKPLALHGGYYDIFRAAELRAELGTIHPHDDIVLDLSATEHLDCACLGVMIRKLRQSRKVESAIELRLVHTTPRLAEMIALLNLDEIFILDDSIHRIGRQPRPPTIKHGGRAAGNIDTRRLATDRA